MCAARRAVPGGGGGERRGWGGTRIEARTVAVAAGEDAGREQGERAGPAMGQHVHESSRCRNEAQR